MSTTTTRFTGGDREGIRVRPGHAVEVHRPGGRVSVGFVDDIGAGSAGEEWATLAPGHWQFVGGRRTDHSWSGASFTVDLSEADEVLHAEDPEAVLAEEWAVASFWDADDRVARLERQLERAKEARADLQHVQTCRRALERLEGLR